MDCGGSDTAFNHQRPNYFVNTGCRPSINARNPSPKYPSLTKCVNGFPDVGAAVNPLALALIGARNDALHAFTTSRLNLDSRETCLFTTASSSSPCTIPSTSPTASADCASKFLPNITTSRMADGRQTPPMIAANPSGTGRPTFEAMFGAPGGFPEPREAVPGHVIERIHADLDDLPTLHRFDVVDLATTSTSFRENALKSVIVLRVTTGSG